MKLLKNKISTIFIMESFNNFCNQNGFIGFNRPQMKTEMKNGVEKKTSPFAGCEKWKYYSQTSIKKHPEWKTFAIMTGKVSDVTVIDFDDHSQLQSFQKAFPDFCKKAFQVKSQSGGLHFYCNYRADVANVSNDIGIDFRNDGGCIFTDGTEVLKMDGTLSRYEFLGGDKCDITDDIFEYFDKLCGNFKTTRNQKKIELVIEETENETTEEEVEEDSSTKQSMIEDLKKLGKKVWDCNSNYYKIIFAICSVLGKKDYAFCKKVTQLFCNQTKQDEFHSWFGSINPKLTGLDRINWASIKHLQPIVEKIQGLENKILTTGLLAEIFVERYEDDWFCKDDILYNWNGIYWEESDKKHTKLVMAIEKEYIPYLLNYSNTLPTDTQEDIKKRGALVTSIAKFRNDKTRDGLKNDILRYATKYDIELNANPYLLTFNNCIFDLRTGKKVEPKKEDYATISTGYNWVEPTKEEKEKIREIVLTILPEKDMRDFYLQILSTGLSGLQLQYLFVATGGGGNGKSVLSSLLSKATGNYGYKIPSKLLQEEIKSGANPEVFNIGYKRFVLGQEPSGKKTICASVMKELTGDNKLNARTHYGTKCEVKLLLTLILEANGIPNMDEVNEAVERRIRIIDFDSKFCDSKEEMEAEIANGRKNVFLKNTYYISDEFQNKYRCAFAQLLMEHFIGFHTNNNALMVMPEKVKKASSNYLKSSDPYYEWFVGDYEKKEKSIIYEADVYARFKSSHFYSLLPKATQRDLKRENFVQKLKSNLFLSKMLLTKLKNERVDLGGEKLTQIWKDGFYGWALKPQEEENVIEDEQN